MRTLVRRLRRAAAPTTWSDVGLAVALAGAAAWFVLAGGGSAPRSVPLGEVGVAAPVTDVPGWLWSDLVANLLVTGLVAIRRRLPVVVFAAQLAVIVTFDVYVTPASVAALLVGGYSLAVHGRTTRMAAGVLVGASAVVAIIERDSWLRLPGWAGAFALLLPGGLAGLAVRSARARARVSEERTAALAREQEAVAGLAVAQERARIARELHDVVSHHVSMMTIQAGAAGAVLDDDPTRARTALSAIEASGRETMTELRHLLGVLHAGDDAGDHVEDEDTQPQPGLEQLGALVRRVQDAGQPVSVQRQAGLVVPPAAALTTYRVVQEALTNAVRHAPGAATRVAVRAEPPSNLVVEVVNDDLPDALPTAPPVRGPVAPPGGGTGLLGLAERLRAHGGTLETGRRLGGGFRVRAVIPLVDATAAIGAQVTHGAQGTDGAP